MELKEESRKLKDLAAKAVAPFRSNSDIGRMTNLTLLYNVYFMVVAALMSLFAAVYFKSLKTSECSYALLGCAGAFAGVATLLRFSINLQGAMVAVGGLLACVGVLFWGLDVALTRLMLIVRLRDEILAANVFAVAMADFVTVERQSFAQAASGAVRNGWGLVIVYFVNIGGIAASCALTGCMCIEQKRFRDRILGVERRRNRYTRLKRLKFDIVDPQRVT